SLRLLSQTLFDIPSDEDFASLIVSMDIIEFLLHLFNKNMPTL
ncbi:hypothetical protein SMU57_04859, partial [Streptococcus mutans NMT4863]